MLSIIQKMKKYIYDYNLISNGDMVIVGVSGGPDSVALLALLQSLKHEMGIQLHVAHYNHKLRQKSDMDQKFVERLAKQYHLPCTAESRLPSQTIKGHSIEEGAREYRFDFLIRLARKTRTKIIALAHTEDDLAETVLMRILRGSGLQGLRSILPKREIKGYHFIRPLLEVKKEEIEWYLNKNNISFRRDPTNKQMKFFRNKIRLELLPLLKERYNKNIREILSHLSENTAIDYDYLNMQSQKIFFRSAKCSQDKKDIRISLNMLMKEHAALRRMVIRLGIARLKGNTNRLTLNHTKEIDDLIFNRPNGSIVDLPGEIGIQKNRNRLIISTRDKLKLNNSANRL